MQQLNIHITPEFEKELLQLMSLRQLSTKAGAVRAAVKEALENSRRRAKKIDFSYWEGLALQVPANKKARFASDDELWE